MNRLLILLYPLLIVFACGNSEPTKQRDDGTVELKNEKPEKEIMGENKPNTNKEVGYITIAHLDMGDGTYMEVLAFSEYGKRGKANRLSHGVKVYILEKRDDEILVETESGTVGWVSDVAVVKSKPKPL